MWDYDKLFAKGNIIGVKNCYENFIYNQIIGSSENNFWVNGYQNNELSYKKQHVINDKDGSEYTTDFEIQYIIRLDEHGNVVEKLFDREEVDMPEPMPELETGMFIRVNSYEKSNLGFVDAENNHVIYQDGGYDFIDDDDINGYGIASKILEVYDKDTCAFDFCDEDTLIWRDPDYQVYLDLDSKYK